MNAAIATTAGHPRAAPHERGASAAIIPITEDNQTPDGA